MIGIVSYGGYIPRLRLERMSIYQQIGWLAPAVVMVAQGERSMCNWDEDSLTMAVAASRDCLRGLDKKQVDALYLASTTLPFADRLNAGIVATALNLRADIRSADFSSTQKAGTTALVAALDAARGGQQALVTASDRRETRAGSFYGMWYGDGAASLLLGDGEVIAEFKGTFSISYDFVTHYRGAGRRFNYTWEERWVRDQGYARIIPEAVDGLLDKLGLTIGDVDRLVYPCFIKREHGNIARKLGAAPEQVADLRKAVTVEQVMASPTIAYPLGLFDCCDVSDGAACAIVATPEVARGLGKKDLVSVKALQLALSSGEEMGYNDWEGDHFVTTAKCSRMAYEEAGITDPCAEISMFAA